MQFTELAVYTMTTQKDRRFKSGENWIEVFEAANKIVIEFDNGEEIFVRFEKGKALVSGEYNNIRHRAVLPINEMFAYLSKHKIDAKILELSQNVPFLHKILTQ